MFTVDCIPAFQDNYIWSIRSPSDQTCIIVDPGDANAVVAYTKKHHLTVEVILITHHHHDHIGGVEALRRQFGCEVYGPKSISVCTKNVVDGDNIQCFSDELQATVMAVPGHTADHLAYHIESMLFCGDTLFSAGCGRIFDGSAKLLHQSLTRLAMLPKNTVIYCAHEYTAANIKFALNVEPSNKALQDYATVVSQKRQQGAFTIPTTLARELEINPYLRCHVPNVRQSVENACGLQLLNEESTFVELRRWKDRF